MDALALTPQPINLAPETSPSIHVQDRLARIQGPGTLLVVSDLHGNLADLQRMLDLLQADDRNRLLLLGDLFHGPEIPLLEWERELSFLGEHYHDESAELFRTLQEATRTWPGRIVSLLGNHDHAHIGGPVVGKFFEDEAANMETRLSAEERLLLHRWLQNLPLIATASCGVAFVHASPPAHPFDLELLRNIQLQNYRDIPINRMYRHDFLGELLWRRGASLPTTERFLHHLAQALPSMTCDVVVHGHQIERGGYHVANPRLLNLSSSFGMLRENKTYLRLDLQKTYSQARQLRPGYELQLLYP